MQSVETLILCRVKANVDEAAARLILQAIIAAGNTSPKPRIDNERDRFMEAVVERSPGFPAEASRVASYDRNYENCDNCDDCNSDRPHWQSVARLSKGGNWGASCLTALPARIAAMKGMLFSLFRHTKRLSE